MNRSSYRNNTSYHKHHKHLYLKISLSIILIIFLLIIGIVTYYASTAPKLNKNVLASDNSTTIYDNKNEVISRLGAQNRDYVSSKDIPISLSDAITSIEDRHFYTNWGIDPIRILKASLHNIVGATGEDNGLQGGSTLTQQLVKLSVFSTASSDQTFKRKVQEAWLALQVDHKYSKKQILEFYINKVYMGNNLYGMQTASEYYFDKPLNELSLSQTALIAGLPQSPTNYDPYLHPQAATTRRNQVLDAMASNKKISNQEAKNAKAIPLNSDLSKTHNSNVTPIKNEKYSEAYIQQVLEELKNKGYDLKDSGLEVHTNLDLNAQKNLYNLANNSNKIPFPNNEFQIGATITDPNNGNVVAMLGGRKATVAFGLNRAVQTNRSSGSTAKPLMDYGPAIQTYKWPTYQPVKDTPYKYPGTNKKVEDFDNKYENDLTMQQALVESRNIPAIRSLEAVGIVNATNFLHGLGLTFNNLLEFQNGIGLYISSEQEAEAYGAFSNGGTYYQPSYISKIVEPNHKDTTYTPSSNKAMDEDTAFMMTSMLKLVLTDPKGSGTTAKVPGLNEAGKTGTTQYPNDYLKKVPEGAAMDSWFTGYTKHYTFSIWTGYDNQFVPGHYVSKDQTKIAQLFYKYGMEDISKNVPNDDWHKPNTMTKTKLNNQPQYYINGHAGVDGAEGNPPNSGDNNNTATPPKDNNNDNKNNPPDNNTANGSPGAKTKDVPNNNSNKNNNQNDKPTTDNKDNSSKPVSTPAPADQQQTKNDKPAAAPPADNPQPNPTPTPAPNNN